MSLPAEVTPARHLFVPDSHNGGSTCLICGEAEDFGALHLPEGPRKPDNSAWKPGDVVRNPKTGALFAVRRGNFGDLEFLELYPTHSQDHAPAEAELLVRDGKACCRCLGCTP